MYQRNCVPTQQEPFGYPQTLNPKNAIDSTVYVDTWLKLCISQGTSNDNAVNNEITTILWNNTELLN